MMIAYTPKPGLSDAIEAANYLMGGAKTGEDNPEYLRGMAELIIDTFAIGGGMDNREVIEEAILKGRLP